jgi:hypothetical protein
VRRWTCEQTLAWVASQFEGGEESSEYRSVAEFFNGFNERPTNSTALFLQYPVALGLSSVYGLVLSRVAAALRHACNGKPFQNWSEDELHDFVVSTMPEDVHNAVQSAKDLYEGELTPENLRSAVADPRLRHVRKLLKRVLSAGDPPRVLRDVSSLARASGIVDASSTAAVAAHVRSAADVQLTDGDLVRHSALRKLFGRLLRPVPLAFSQARDLARELATLFSELGIAPGDRVYNEAIRLVSDAETRAFMEDWALLRFLNARAQYTEHAWEMWAYQQLLCDPLHKLLLSDRFHFNADAFYNSSTAIFDREAGTLRRWAIKPDFAVWHQRSEVLVFFSEHKASDEDALLNITPLYLAASNGHSMCVELLLRAGAEPNARGNGDATPLHYAAMSPHSERIVKALLAAGAIPLFRRSSSGSSCSMCATGRPCWPRR